MIIWNSSKERYGESGDKSCGDDGTVSEFNDVVGNCRALCAMYLSLSWVVSLYTFIFHNLFKGLSTRLCALSSAISFISWISGLYNVWTVKSSRPVDSKNRKDLLTWLYAFLTLF